MKKLAPEAIKAAVENAKKPNRYPGARCQGKGGICPNLATHRTNSIPGGYCEICIAEVDRTIEVMRKYVAEHDLLNQDRIVAKLTSMGFIARKTATLEGKNKKKRGLPA